MNRIGKMENVELKRMNYVKHHGFHVLLLLILVYLIHKCINNLYIFLIINLSFDFSISQIDTFGQQQPGLENQFKNLSQGLSKYIERHTEVYERDIQKICELFSKVHLAVQVDTATPGKIFLFFQI